MKKITLFISLLFVVAISAAQTTYILCGKILNTKTGKIETKRTLAVKGKKIINAYKGYVQPKNATAKIINLKDKFVLPELIDVHKKQKFDVKKWLNTCKIKSEVNALKAIQTATITAAKLLGKENEIGQLQVGFYANIIAVDDNPLQNIQTLEKLVFVMKDGAVYKK